MIENLTATRSALAAVSLAILMLACTAPPNELREAETPASPRAGSWTTPDGVEIPFTVGGIDGAATTVVLVHCWMCDSTFWSEQIPALEGEYRFVTLDLPGHGKAGAGRESWSVASYGADVAGLIEHLDLERVILVGHSMGGPVSLKAAASAPGRVLGVVGVDTLQDAEFEFDTEAMQGFLAAFEADFETTCALFVDGMFPESDAAPVKSRVADVGCDPSHAEIGVALLRDFTELNLAAWMSEAGVPIRAINSDANPTQPATNRKYADFDHVEMTGVGHYLHMTRPEEFNRHLLAILEELAEG